MNTSISIEQLKCFVAVSKNLNFRKAAKNLNGVAIYNRTNEFINIIYTTINSCLNTRRNYDTILSEYIRAYTNKHNMSDKLFNSAFICDLSPESQENINYRTIKPLTRILHQKR